MKTTVAQAQHAIETAPFTFTTPDKGEWLGGFMDLSLAL